MKLNVSWDGRGMMPPGYYIEWSGQYENQISAKIRLRIVIQVVLVFMFKRLYITTTRFGKLSMFSWPCHSR